MQGLALSWQECRGTQEHFTEVRDNKNITLPYTIQSTLREKLHLNYNHYNVNSLMEVHLDFLSEQLTSGTHSKNI